MTAHGALEADFPPGTAVIYHVNAAIDPAFGLVVRANDHYVFVRFGRGKPSMAVQPDFLAIVADPIPDPRIQMIEDLIAERKPQADDGEDSFIAVLEDVLVGAVDSSSEEES